GKVDLMGLTTGYLKDTDFPKLTTIAGKISNDYAIMYINDTGGITLAELEATALKMVRDGVQVMMIDYLQLITGIKAENRQNEISIISASLKRLAKKLNIPVVAISQLSRAVEQRAEKKPQLSDLRESGAIEQDADVVLLLYREEYYNPKPENEGLAEIHIAKHREGMTGIVKLAFLKQYVCFENLAKVEEYGLIS
ncbi:MAG: DnaB-like helicase C-terminal domain-containing protein, partial [bacterium]